MTRRFNRFLALFCTVALLFTLIPVSAVAADMGDPYEVGVPIPVWDSVSDAALGALGAGANISGISQLKTGGGAVLTAQKNVEIKNMYDMVDWTVPTAIEVRRSATADSLLLDPEALGLEVGKNYIFEIEGIRTSGTPRASFGTFNQAGSLTSRVTPVNAANFTLKATVTHTADIKSYTFYGSSNSGGTSLATGNFTIYSIRVSEQNSGTLYYNDFEDGDFDIVKPGHADKQTIHEVVVDSTNPANKVLRTKVEGAGYAGLDIKGIPVLPGSNIRVSLKVRRVSASDGYTGTSTYRISSGVAGVVANWEFARDRKAIGTDWTTYSMTSQLPVGTEVFAFQFCKDTEAYEGVLEFDDIIVEILDSPVGAAAATWEEAETIPSISEAYDGLFMVGNIVDAVPAPGSAFEKMFLQQYNAVATENAMKPGGMSPSEGVYNFEGADKIVDWANANGLYFAGHTLVWHAQSANWLHSKDGKALTYAEGHKNLIDYITTVAGHYEEKGVDAWDVINEMFNSDNQTGNWKSNMRPAGQEDSQSKWRAVYTNQAPAGVNHWDFVYDAFVAARKAAPSATLRYNDFNNDNVGKTQNMADMANEMNAIWATDTVNNPQADAKYGTPYTGTNSPTASQLKQNTDIVTAYLADGGRLLVEVLGAQSHYGSTTNFTTTSGSYSVILGHQNLLKAVGVKIHATELDLGDDATSFDTARQRKNYNDLFKFYIANADRIELVNFWGTNDVQSWRSSNNPALFTRPTARTPIFRAKPAFYDVVALGVAAPRAGAVITDAAIALAAPVAGAAPVLAIDAAQYTGTVTWSPAVTGNAFAAGTAYTATITLTPKEGFTLKGVAANSFTVAGATTVTNAADSGVITAVFPATEAAKVYTLFDLQATLAPYPVGYVITGINGLQAAGPAVLTVIDAGNGKKGITVTGRTADWNAIDILLAPLGLVVGGNYRYTISGNKTAAGSLQIGQSSEPWGSWLWGSGISGDFTREGVFSSTADILKEGQNIRISINSSTDDYTITDFKITTTDKPADKVISIPALTVARPVTGAAPVTLIDEAQYSATVAWSPAVSGDAFAAGTAYTATITLTPKDGYTLEGVAANFFTVSGATTVTNAANSGVVTAVFPATAAAGVYTVFDLQTVLKDLKVGDVITGPYKGIAATGAKLTVVDAGGGKKGIEVSGRANDWDALDISTALFYQGQDYTFTVSGRTTTNTSMQYQDTVSYGAYINQTGANNTTFTHTRTQNALSAGLAFAKGKNFRIKTTDTATYTITDIVITTKTNKVYGDTTASWRDVPSLKDAYKDMFLLGSLDKGGYNGTSGSALLNSAAWLKHFNAITAENAMKPDTYGAESTFRANNISVSSGATTMMNWAKANSIPVHGHVFLWHGQSATWMTGTSLSTWVTRDVAKANMELFIKNIAEKFEAQWPGQIYSWDVINEAFTNGNGIWRESLRDFGLPNATEHRWWHAYENGANKAAGESGADYMYDAFVFARKYVPTAKLVYNDFNMDTPSKFKSVADMILELNAKWAKDTANNAQAKATYTGTSKQIINAYKADGGRLLIETAGIQSHHSVGTSLKNIEESFVTLIDTGVTLAITELDIVIPGTNYSSSASSRIAPTEEQLMEQGRYTAALSKIYKKYADSIDRVTWWGVSDNASWLSGYGLPFSANLADSNNPLAKPAYWAMLDPDRFEAMYGEYVVPGGASSVRKFGFAVEGTPDITVNDAAAWDKATWSAKNTIYEANRFVDNTTEGATGAFRVLWDDNFLYVRAEVSKDGALNNSSANEWENDSVEVFVSETNNRGSSWFTNPAMGTGDGQYRVDFQNKQSFANGAATAADGFESAAFIVDGGYVVQMKIPFRAGTPADNTDIGIDFQVNTRVGDARTGIAAWCDTSNGMLWQGPAPMGQISLVKGTTPIRETTSAGTAVYGSPAGINDEAWEAAETLNVNKWTSDASVRAASGKAKTMWDEKFLYAVIEVTDSVIDTTNGSTWLQDSIEFCLDKNNLKVNGYPDTANNGGQFRVTLDNVINSNPSSAAAAAKSEVEMTATGYKVYIAIPIDSLKLDPTKGGQVSFDIQINDAANGDRFGIATWSDHTASGYANSTRFGDLLLKVPGEPVDTEELVAAVEEAEELVENAYTSESWTAFNAALVAAKEVLANEAATQEEIDAALLALATAIEGLIERGDKTELEAIIEIADELVEQAYTTATWNAYVAARAAANIVIANIDALQADIDEAYAALEAAIAALVARGDKTALIALIAETNALVEQTYVTATWNAFVAARVTANVIVANIDAIQTEVDTAYTALAAAVNGLVKRGDNTALVALIQAAQSLNRLDYKASSWNILLGAIVDALDVVVNIDATQPDVDAAVAALQSVINNLVKLISSTPTASVVKQNGNKNTLTVVVTEKYSDGSTETITLTIQIDNNSSGTYTVGRYKVYVDTKGNDQIRECYIVK